MFGPAPPEPPKFAALTCYGATIPHHIGSRQEARAWAAAYADTFPGCRVIQHTKRGRRTIWRHEPAPQETTS